MQAVLNLFGKGVDAGGVRFWEHPERVGWLWKQGKGIF